MGVRAPSWEEVEQAAQEYATGAGGEGHFPTVPRVYNEPNVQRLGGPRSLAWGPLGQEVQYEVLPMDFRLSAELYTMQLELAQLHQERQQRLQEAGEELATNLDLEREREDTQRQLQLAQRSVDVMGQLVRPQERWRRWLWRLGVGRRPFQDATVEEVVELMDFFYNSPTSTRVRGSRAATFERARRG